jgi:hypothetical protein
MATALERFEDGQLSVPGLHDARLIGIALPDEGGMRLAFRPEKEGRIDLVVSSDARPHLWAEDVVLPNIVSSAWLVPAGEAEATARRWLEEPEAARVLRQREIYLPGGWLLGITMNYGHMIAVFGARTAALSAVTVERSAS